MASAISSLQSPQRPRPQWIDRLSHLFRAYDQATEAEERDGRAPRFRFVANFIEIWGFQSLVLLAIALVAPHWWHGQMQAGIPTLLATFVAVGFFISAPFEWFFHRFGLHRLLFFRAFSGMRIVPEAGTKGLALRWRRAANNITIGCIYNVARMTFAHGAHHKKTDVTPVNPDRLAELFNAISRYEITSNEQTEHAAFPHFSVVAFWIATLPVALLLQAAANALGHAPGFGFMAHLPIMISMMLSMSWQVWAYENSHAIMHMRYDEWWRPRIQNSPFGWWYSAVYRFHFFHHMNETCSLGVVGALWFCYFWDRVFGTYKLARIELIECASRTTRDILEMRTEEIMLLPDARPDDFAAPGPTRTWIARLDAEATKAQHQWNALFVAALQEVRQRRVSG